MEATRNCVNRSARKRRRSLRLTEETAFGFFQSLTGAAGPDRGGRRPLSVAPSIGWGSCRNFSKNSGMETGAGRECHPPFEGMKMWANVTCKRNFDFVALIRSPRQRSQPDFRGTVYPLLRVRVSLEKNLSGLSPTRTGAGATRGCGAPLELLSFLRALCGALPWWSTQFWAALVDHIFPSRS